MTIDFHAHPVPEAFRKWLPLLNIDVIKDDGFPVPQWSKRRLCDMKHVRSLCHILFPYDGKEVSQAFDLHKHLLVTFHFGIS